MAPTSVGDALLDHSSDGNNWALVSYAAGASTPSVLGSFTFFGADSLRPVAQDHFASGMAWEGLTSRWGTLAVGDFDGDKIDDFAFPAVGSDGRLAIGHLLSRERNPQEQFVMARAVALGGWDRDDPLGQSDYAAVNLMATDLDGDRVLSLIVHRTDFAGGQPIGADILVLQPNPTASQGACPTSPPPRSRPTACIRSTS